MEMWAAQNNINFVINAVFFYSIPSCLTVRDTKEDYLVFHFPEISRLIMYNKLTFDQNYYTIIHNTDIK